MISKYFKVTLLLIFLATTILVVFIQYNSIKNIDELVSGNENLLVEFGMKNKLQRLQNEILSIDNKVRSAVIRNKVDDPNFINDQVIQVQATVKDLAHLLVTDTSKRLWEELYFLTEEKIRFSKLILETFSSSGKQSAEDFINTQRGIRLTEAISRVSKQLEYARQSYITEIVQETDANSLRAKRFGFVLATVAITIVLMAFWFISSRLKQQQQLIEQLNESERLEREASKVKEHFIANMSHEIRTPMNAILGFVTLLQKQQLDKKSSLYVDTIYESSEKLLTIINDVLDLSKIEAGMMRIEKSEFDFSELMNSVKSMLDGKAKEKKLQVIYQVDNEIPNQLIGDPIRISQILVNLVSNAIKFTEKGTINVNAKLLEQAQDSIVLGIQVNDVGIGIAPDQLAKIFDRFTQAEESTTRKYGGTGLGLSIVQQIATLLGGKVTVESELGKGASFNVEIPMDIAVQTVAETGNPAIKKEKAEVVKKIKILVVEDNAMNQMLMEHILEAWNHEYKIADNGQVALDILSGEIFNLVLMDIQMPEMDGYTAAKKIRDDLQLNIPIIAMTAHAFEGEKERCILAGMTDYISKPLREQELEDMIIRYAYKTDNVIETVTNTHLVEIVENSSSIDLAYLRDISGGNTAFEKDILKQFILQAPEELQQLNNAFVTRNWRQIRSKAHILKTTISFLGLQPLLLNDLEQLEQIELDSMNSTGIHQSIQQVTTVCLQALQEAKEILGKPHLTS